MGNQITVKVEGIEAAISKLKKWEVIKIQGCKDVLLKAGYEVEADAKKGTPVWTGRLRNSMTTNWSGSGKARMSARAPAKAEDTVGEPAGAPGLVVVVGSNVSYAHMQEYGSWGGAEKPGKGMKLPKRTHEAMPRPAGGFQMLTKAYLKNKNKLAKKIGEVLKKGVA